MASGCRIPASTEVVSSYPPETIEVTVTSELFSDNNILEVSVVGTGEYEYRLDFGPWQRETLFENVRIGEHTIYVRDLLNCNEITQKKIVIGYPKFFTPNGDTVNDTWQVSGFSSQFPVTATVKIFNRFGKLLTILNSSNSQWDGNYKGKLLPSDDYWFEAILADGRTFKGHFTLVNE